MKKTLLTLLVLTYCISGIQAYSQGEYTTVTISMGPNYENDIYYSFENGIIKKTARNNWDIAFYTSMFSAGILTNEGNGVMLYTYPAGDTADWASVDTAGMSGWQPMYNSPTNWEDGAFNSNASGHPDYGWCIYNPVTHNLTGDSLFIIDIPNAGVKKLWIMEKQSVNNIYIIRYADIDGTNEHTKSIDVKHFTDKRFAYYSIANDDVPDREPDANTWDILFTKYMDLTEDNEGNLVPYIVTGATSNISIGANNFYPVALDFQNWWEKPFDTTKNTIGYDWKIYNNGYVIVDSNYYFVQNYNGDVYKLTFAFWEGSSTGVFAFDKMLVSLSSVFDKEINDIKAYPNPASSFVTITAEDNNLYNSLIIYDQSGRVVYQSDLSHIDLENSHRVNLDRFDKGMYIIRLAGNNTNSSLKLLVR